MTFISEEPKFAADAVNTLIDEYVSENLEIKLRSTQGMLDWLGTELATQQKRVEDSERALAEYREKENALSLDDKQNIVLVAAQPAERHRGARAQPARVQKESLYNQVKAIASGTSPDAIPVIATNGERHQRAQDQAAAICSARRSRCSSATPRSIRRSRHQRAARGRAEAARPRDRRRGAVGPQRVRDRGDRGADVRARTSKARRAKRPT